MEQDFKINDAAQEDGGTGIRIAIDVRSRTRMLEDPSLTVMMSVAVRSPIVSVTPARARWRTT